MTNQTKNTTALTGQSRTVVQITWDQATFTWDGAGDKTWDDQTPSKVNQAKNSTIMTGQTKH